MNYQRIYDSLIERGKNRILKGYSENHHIIPKCLSGSNDKENLVRLTAEEHYVAHQLLVKIYPGHSGLSFAMQAMTMKNKYHRRNNNKLYGLLRKQHSRAVSKLFKNIPKSENHKAKLRLVCKLFGEKNGMFGKSGKDSPNFGQKRSLKTKRLMSKVNSRSIICTTSGITYPSLKAAAKLLNLSVSGISHVLRERRKHTGGYTFEYVKRGDLSL